MNLPQLDMLMGAYYHEDFDIYGGLFGALEQYLRDATSDDIAQLDQELKVVLRDKTEVQVEQLLDELTCAVYMGDEPGGYRGWLEEIARRVEAWLKA